MLLNSCQHSFFQKHSSHTWIVISGWAIDGTYAFKPSTSSNTLFISYYNPYTLHQLIPELLATYRINSFSILGFSLGGLWLSNTPEISSQANHCIYVSVRKHYPKRDISFMKRQLTSNAHNCLNSFYQQCCSTPSQIRSLQTYHTPLNCSNSILQHGLTYLRDIPFNMTHIIHSYQFYHGKCDRISPFQELSWINNKQLTVFPRMGHVEKGLSILNLIKNII